MELLRTRTGAAYGALVALSTAFGLMTNWRLSLWLLLVVLGAALGQALSWRSPTLWLYWLHLRLGRSVGIKRVASRIAKAIDPPTTDERYAWDSRTRDGVPRVVPVRLADRHKAWPHWAFNVRILRNGVEICGGPHGPVMTVRFGRDDFAIYNNEGKKWLRSHPRSGENYQAREVLERELAAALGEAEGRHDGWTTTLARGFPLRWASGGCLPIVSIDGEKWVAVMFRDLAPIGWNVANGGSESVREQTEVTAVLRREFREELIVLSQDPLPSTRRHPNSVYVRTLLWAGERREKRRHSPGLALRRRDDDMTFVDDEEGRAREAVEVVPRDTPWRIRVISADGKVTWLDNIFPSLDSREHGIEAIQVVTFRLDSRNVLLDGEVLEKADALARRPVVLLSLHTLRALYARTGGLGQRLSTGSKSLPALTESDVLSSDLELRLARSRLAGLEQNTVSTAGDPVGEEAHLSQCIARHEALLRNRLEPMLQLNRLAPVTWATLESLFALDARQSGAPRPERP